MLHPLPHTLTFFPNPRPQIERRPWCTQIRHGCSGAPRQSSPALLLPDDSLFLGFDCSTQLLKATALDADLAIVAHDAVHFDTELPHYATGGCVRRDPAERGHIVQLPLMWDEALDLLLRRLHPIVDYARVVAVSDSSQQHDNVYWRGGAGVALESLDPTRGLAARLDRAFGVPEWPVWMDNSSAVPVGRGRPGRRTGAGPDDGVPGSREVHCP